MKQETPATYQGRTQSVDAWAKEFQILPKSMTRRINKMAPQRAFLCPIITFRGETMRLGQWAEKLGLSRTALRFRLERWPLEIAMTKPRGPRGPIRDNEHDERA